MLMNVWIVILAAVINVTIWSVEPNAAVHRDLSYEQTRNPAKVSPRTNNK